MSGSGEKPAGTAGGVAWEAMTPCDLAGFVVDCGQIVAEGRYAQFLFSAQAHGAAGIGLGEVVHGVGIILRDVEQPSLGAESRRRPIGDSSVCRRNQSAADVEVLLRVSNGLATLVHPGIPVRSFGEFARDQVLAGDPIEGE